MAKPTVYNEGPRHFDASDVPHGIGHVTRTFNAVCSEAGVQCSVSPNANPFDPIGSNHIYYFENLGDQLVMVSYCGETRYIEPGEKVALKVPSDHVPEVRTCNYGDPDA